MAEERPGLTSEAFRRDRPRSGILIAVALALVFIPALAIWSSVRNNHDVLYGRWYFGYLAVIAAACAVAAAGLWRRRRWGAWIAWLTLLGNLAFTVYLGDATLFSAALPVGLCAALLLEYQELM